jgi:hypothetical protein
MGSPNDVPDPCASINWIVSTSTSVLLPWESHFQADQEICFEAIPETDREFINWTGDFQSNENPACVILDTGLGCLKISF